MTHREHDASVIDDEVSQVAVPMVTTRRKLGSIRNDNTAFTDEEQSPSRTYFKRWKIRFDADITAGIKYFGKEKAH